MTDHRPPATPRTVLELLGDHAGELDRMDRELEQEIRSLEGQGSHGALVSALSDLRSRVRAAHRSLGTAHRQAERDTDGR